MLNIECKIFKKKQVPRVTRTPDPAFIGVVQLQTHAITLSYRDSIFGIQLELLDTLLSSGL